MVSVYKTYTELGIAASLFAEILIALVGNDSKLRNTLKWDCRKVSLLVCVYQRD